MMPSKLFLSPWTIPLTIAIDFVNIQAACTIVRQCSAPTLP
jgi:hypothetical protein